MNFNVNNQNASFLFYDYETFGLHPALDKVAQFASVRTDRYFNIIEPAQCFYCIPPNDYLPHPKSVLITGITPQYTMRHGMNEFNFAKRIYNIFSTHNTCILGYNNIHFDDEFTRNIFYRNFFDIYSWSWKNNNSRWDLLNVLRAYYVLRPNGIIWTKNTSGFTSFKLNDFTRSNNINHDHVHDAVSDVYATISVAKLLKSKQPRLFQFLFYHRIKNTLKSLINIIHPTPLIYISATFGNIRNNMTCIMPIMWNIKNSNMLIFFDLYMNINVVLSFLKNQSIHNFNFQKLFSLGIKFLYVNQCPILVPFNVLNAQQFLRIGINLNTYLLKINIFLKHIFLFRKIDIFFKNYIYNCIYDNVDLKIYTDFFNQSDKNKMKIIHNTSLDILKNMHFNFDDTRLNEMFFRYRARNFPHGLNGYDQKKWLIYRLKIFNKNFLSNYLLNIQNLIHDYSLDIKKIDLLKCLNEYVNTYFLKFLLI